MQDIASERNTLILLSKDKSTRFCLISLLIGSDQSLASRLSKQL